MGGFIAQAFAVKYTDRVDKLVLLSTDPGGTEADFASPDVWSNSLTRPARLTSKRGVYCSCFFQPTSPNLSIAEFGDIVAAARAQVSVELLNRQAAAMDAWHRNGIDKPTARVTRAGVNRYRSGGHRDSRFKRLETCKRNSWRLACSVPSRRPCLHRAVSTNACRSNQQFSGAYERRVTPAKNEMRNHGAHNYRCVMGDALVTNADTFCRSLV